jgi:hypothetical protein
MPFLDMKAAADFTGPGAIEVPLYEREITDIVRRTSNTLQRMPGCRATGHPHRYFEQTAVAAATFTNPRSISPTPATPTRSERAAMIKAITNETDLSLFDVNVTQQQGQFVDLEAKDIQDIVSGIVLSQAAALWAGTDTSLTSPTTNQYVGLLTQITQQATIAPGASIIDGLKAQVAAMVGNQTFVNQPTAIYANAVLLDYIDREAKAQNLILNTMEVVAGVKVKSIMTQAGEIPLIPDPFLGNTTDTSYGFGAPPAGNKNWMVAIVQENMVERPYISGAEDNPMPRLFQLGLLANLAAKHVGIMFDSVIAKGPSYAHSVVAVQRP